jgi:hypothetical protein
MKRLDKAIWATLTLWLALTALLPLLGQSQIDFALKVAKARYGLLPANWTVVLVGDDAWWDQCLRAGVITISAYTYPDQRTTYLRRSYAETAPLHQLRHTMAHEAGHLACGCGSEVAAERWAKDHE